MPCRPAVRRERARSTWTTSGHGAAALITVDPEKDKAEQLKSYVALFHPGLIGLAGGVQAIRSVSSAEKVHAAKSEPSKQAVANIDHSSFVFLVDAAGKYLAFFPPGTSADRMVES
jgi:protein SCO1/2